VIRTLALCFTAALAACGAAPSEQHDRTASQAQTTAAPAQDGTVALFTTLPIYWPEGDVGDMLSGKAQEHWAKVALASRFDLVPLDTLSEIPTGATLLMAQPRELSPDENVALDTWVRTGGHVLMLVDPMLETESIYGLGDRRRPSATASLSPILNRWGLTMNLVPDAGEAHGEHAAHNVAWDGLVIPVESAGVLSAYGKGHDSKCTVAAKGLVAACAIGKGRTLVLADATLLANGDGAGEGRDSLLLTLIDRANAGPPTP